MTREGVLTSRCHSQKKHLGYENLAEDPGSGECHYFYPHNVVCLMNGGATISRRKSQTDESPPPWNQQQLPSLTSAGSHLAVMRHG